ncbi:MAG: TonB-dependent receptor [Caulobacteraceae bacterium]
MRIVRSLLFATTAISGVLLSSAAFAQDNGRGGQDAEGIAEVVVTATRQSDTVSRVPLTVQAVTQRNLDEQGIKNAADLVRIVPGLNVAANPGGTQQTFSIRGIVGGTGAATTGVYLDDANLTKRSNGGVSQNNGVNVPLLYDLERVEVLKGPQGTLYGGSSEGGTIRFITPAPSLTRYSGSARAELNDYTGHGERGYELGAAIGGPIIQDKLGFRISGIRRNTGGYIDAVNAYDGSTVRANANSVLEWAGRASLLWQVTDRATAQVSWYHTYSKNEGGSGSTTAIYLPNGQVAPAGQTFTTPAMCITGYRPATIPYATPGGPAGQAYVPANAVCTPANQASALFVRPSYTYGPYTARDNVNILTGRQAVVGPKSESDVASVTLNYDFEHMNVKSITSYLHDHGSSNQPGGEDYAGTTAATNAPGQFTSLDTAHRGFPLFAGYPNQVGTFLASNKRRAIEEELRFSSVGDTRLTWVAGIYFSNSSTHINYFYRVDPGQVELEQKLIYGPRATTIDRYGADALGGYEALLDANVIDTEFAGFAEANFKLTQKLKLIAGVRQSRVGLDYRQVSFGAFSARLPSSQGAVTTSKGDVSPITPKFGVQYQFTDNDMAYFTAAKGFRAGGANSQLSQSICGSFLAPYGLTADTVPAVYAPDTVWSYELGTKVRLLDNKLQINAAGYRIDWSAIQATITLACGQGFVAAGGKARSQGVDLQAQYRPIQPLTLTLNFGYTDAHYIDPVGGVNGVLAAGQRPSINSGDAISGSGAPIQISTSAQYNMNLFGKYDSYLRVDYQYQNQYASGPSLGATGFNPLTRVTRARDTINLRAGVRLGGMEVNAFVQNLLDAHAPIGSGLANGRGLCSSTSQDCSVFSTFSPFVLQTYQAPRKVGIQANYRF